jgi:hypothetical protein
MIDVYGRERHPENSGTSTQFLQESYNDRRQRAQMMLYTLNNISSPPDNRIFLIDEEGPEVQRQSTYSTKVTHMYGGRPQGAIIIDLDGKIILTQVWERAEQGDEILSNIFGLAPGL